MDDASPDYYACQQALHGVWVGGEDSARDKQSLVSKGIAGVLVIGSYLKAHFPADFTYKSIEVKDRENELLMSSFEVRLA